MSSIAKEAKAITEGEDNLIANLANIAALVFHSYDKLNWAGFYLKDRNKNELILGPFQGKVACLRIPFGKGVCGTAWKDLKTQNVPNVHAIENHIACDGASQSELVFPLMSGTQFWGVLDIDSPVTERFDSQMQSDLQKMVDEVLIPIFVTCKS